MRPDRPVAAGRLAEVPVICHPFGDEVELSRRRGEPECRAVEAVLDEDVSRVRGSVYGCGFEWVIGESFPMSHDDNTYDLIVTGAGSTAFLDLVELPKRMLFGGGSFISFEFAHIAARAGSRPVIVDRGLRPLKGFDPDLVDLLIDRGTHAGIETHTKTSIVSVEADGSSYLVTTEQDGEQSVLETDLVVHGAGRISELSMALTPIAVFEGKVAASNMLKSAMNVPDDAGGTTAVFTIPELARVGMLESEAVAAGIDLDVRYTDTSGWYSNYRIGETTAAVKILVDTSSDTIFARARCGGGPGHHARLRRWPHNSVVPDRRARRSLQRRSLTARVGPERFRDVSIHLAPWYDPTSWLAVGEKSAPGRRLRCRVSLRVDVPDVIFRRTSSWEENEGARLGTTTSTRIQRSQSDDGGRFKMSTLPYRSDGSVKLPSAMRGLPNGKIPSDLLVPCGIRTLLMTQPAAEAMKAMVTAAASDGVTLSATGTWRSFDEQKNLFLSRYTTQNTGLDAKTWDGQTYWKKSKSLAGAASPGTSNHGIGLAADLSDSPTVPIGQARLDWLSDHGPAFGFWNTVRSESWHWTYCLGDDAPPGLDIGKSADQSKRVDWDQIKATDAKLAAIAYSGELANGSDGDAVRAVQWKLAAAGHVVTVDGEFGRKTLAAVQVFQRLHGLKPDGRVGRRTWAALGLPADSTEVAAPTQTV